MRPHHLLPLALGAALCSAPAMAQKSANREEAEQTNTAFPALDILPKGSILQRVRFPRYDKDFRPESLLTADKLTVLDSSQIDGENVTIHLFDSNGQPSARTHMRHAIYHQKNSTLQATQPITLTGDSYRATGQGLIFHFRDNRGFLIGPATTEFEISANSTPTTMFQAPHRPLKRPTALAGTVLTLATSLIAEPPRPLTPAELAELDAISRPSESLISKDQQSTSKSIAEEKKIMDAADTTMREFMNSIGHQALLISSDSPAEDKQSATAPKKPQPVDKDQAPKLLKVECDGGLYFDTDTGVLAYLKNIRLRDERFQLTCRDELKVFLDQKKEDPAKKASDAKSDNKTSPAKNTPAADKSTPAADKNAKDKEEDKSFTQSFGELKRIVAIGKVRVVSKDEKGKTFIATAETASYDAQSGEMILRGGLPRIQYGPNQYLESQAPGQYIRMLKSGKLLTTGKWAMQIDTSQATSSDSKAKSTTP